MPTERRPYPPLGFTNPENFRPYIAIIPANEVYSWVSDNLLMENGNLHNEDHFHLHTADIGFMWASGAFEKKGRYVLGQCDQVMLRAGGWQKARMEQQMHECLQKRLSADSLCGTGPNTRIIETDSGYAVIDVSLKPRQQSTVLIAYDGLTDFAKVMGRAFITRDGEAIEGDALDDVHVLGVVTFTIIDVRENQSPV